MRFSGQIKELRECVEECDNPLYDMKMKRIAKLMNQAADIIEALSANLAANDSEWINDEKPKESGYYFITTDTVLMGEVDSNVGYWDGEHWNTFSNVYAWKPINFPKPYRP